MMMKFWAAHRKTLVFCLIVTFIWGFCAHGYVFANFQLSHDALDGLYSEGSGRENAHKIELGRVLVPAYRYLFRGLFATPWLIGLLALAWIALAVWMVVSALEVQSRPLMVLIGGVMTVNIPVTALAGTYLHDLDQNMFGMMMACLAVLLWRKRPRGWIVMGAAAAAVCLAIYPAFISTAIGLMMIILLMELLNGEKASRVVRRGVEGAAGVALGGGMFLLILWGVTTATGIPLASRANSLGALASFQLAYIPSLLAGAYENWRNAFLAMPNTWLTSQAASVINAALLLFAAGMLIPGTLLRKNLSAAQKVWIVLIALLLPLGMNVSYILSSGFIHHLMQYAFSLFYVLCLLLAQRLLKSRTLPRVNGAAGWCCFALVALILWSGVQTANIYHFKKNSAAMATNAHMTNVYHDMLAEGYIPGETPLVVKGSVYIASPEGFEDVSRILGAAAHNTITDDPKSIRSYFKYVLGDDAQFCPDEQWEEIVSDSYVEYMPTYPEYGYIDYVDEVMIVNLS